MHFIAVNVVTGGAGANLDEGFIGGEGRDDIEQAQAIDATLGPLDAAGILDALAQHLITAAQAEDGTAAAVMSANVDIPAGVIEGA